MISYKGVLSYFIVICYRFAIMCYLHHYYSFVTLNLIKYIGLLAYYSIIIKLALYIYIFYHINEIFRFL